MSGRASRAREPCARFARRGIPTGPPLHPRRRVRLIALLAFRDEAAYLPGYLRNVAPARRWHRGARRRLHRRLGRAARGPPRGAGAAACPTGPTRLGRAGQLPGAGRGRGQRHGPGWAVSLDADERVEHRFRARAERAIARGRRFGLTRLRGPAARAVGLARTPGGPTAYGAKGAAPDVRAAPRPPLRRARAARRQGPAAGPAGARGGAAGGPDRLPPAHGRSPRTARARRERYEALDPEAEFQPREGYAYLTDDRGHRAAPRRPPARLRRPSARELAPARASCHRGRAPASAATPARCAAPRGTDGAAHRRRPRLAQRVDRPALEHELHALVQADAHHGLAQQVPAAARRGSCSRRAACPASGAPPRCGASGWGSGPMRSAKASTSSASLGWNSIRSSRRSCRPRQILRAGLVHADSQRERVQPAVAVHQRAVLGQQPDAVGLERAQRQRATCRRPRAASPPPRRRAWPGRARAGAAARSGRGARRCARAGRGSRPRAPAARPHPGWSACPRARSSTDSARPK